MPVLSASPLLSLSKGLLRGCLPSGRGACPRCQQGHFWASWAQCGGADTPVGWPAAEGQQEGRSGGGLLQVLLLSRYLWDALGTPKPNPVRLLDRAAVTIPVTSLLVLTPTAAQ